MLALQRREKSLRENASARVGYVKVGDCFHETPTSVSHECEAESRKAKSRLWKNYTEYLRLEHPFQFHSFLRLTADQLQCTSSLVTAQEANYEKMAHRQPNYLKCLMSKSYRFNLRAVDYVLIAS